MKITVYNKDNVAKVLDVPKEWNIYSYEINKKMYLTHGQKMFLSHEEKDLFLPVSMENKETGEIVDTVKEYINALIRTKKDSLYYKIEDAFEAANPEIEDAFEAANPEIRDGHLDKRDELRRKFKYKVQKEEKKNLLPKWEEIEEFLADDVIMNYVSAIRGRLSNETPIWEYSSNWWTKSDVAINMQYIQLSKIPLSEIPVEIVTKISKSPAEAYYYARLLKGRFPEGEATIMKSIKYRPRYLALCLQEKFGKISKNGTAALDKIYAL